MNITDFMKACDEMMDELDAISADELANELEEMGPSSFGEVFMCSFQAAAQKEFSTFETKLKLKNLAAREFSYTCVVEDAPISFGQFYASTKFDGLEDAANDDSYPKAA